MCICFISATNLLAKYKVGYSNKLLLQIQNIITAASTEIIGSADQADLIIKLVA